MGRLSHASIETFHRNVSTIESPGIAATVICPSRAFSPWRARDTQTGTAATDGLAFPCHRRVGCAIDVPMPFGNMEFTGKLTEEDLSDVRQLYRSRSSRMSVLAGKLRYGIVPLFITWATITALARHERVQADILGVMWLAVVGLMLWIFYRVKQSHARTLSRLDAALPDKVILTNDGVKSDGPDGATSFLPWNSFKGFREGQRVILVDRGKGITPVALLIGGLSENERRSLRDFLRSHIPSITR